MVFPEKEVYTELVDELKARAYYFVDQGHVAPAHYDMDRGQYEVQGDKDEHPFNRAAIFFKFGEMDLEMRGSQSRKVTIPLEVTVVQDKYVDSQDGASDQTAFLKLLEYKILVNDVLDRFSGTCFSELSLVTIVPDEENRNFLVEKLRYSITGTLLKRTVPEP